MEFLAFTLVAVALYFAADWILVRLERAAGRRLEERTLIFFFMLLGLGLLAFAVIRRLFAA